MSRLLTLLVTLTTVLVFTFAASAVNVPITIGASDSFSRYPIGLDPSAVGTAFPNFAAGGVYQQVYAKSAFSGPVIITQIAFASNAQMTSGPGTANFDLNVSLGTTAVGPNSLSTNLAANRGAELVPVFSGPLTSTITDNDQFDVFIDITPFTYDPANGNLLLELTVNSPVQFSAGQFLYFRAGNDSRTSRAANPSGVAGGAFTDSFGVLTRFMTTTTSPAQVTLGNLVQTFDGNPKTVSVTTNPPGLGVAVSYNGSATAPTNAGLYAVTAIVTDPAFEGQASGNLVIESANQQITFDSLADKAFGDADFNVSATASSNLAVTFSAGGNCSVAGTLVHLNGVGQCTITASQDGNSNYHAAAPVARTFTIVKAAQQITFEPLSNKTIGDADFNVTATASSNLAVGFSAAGNCTVNATLVHLTGSGLCTITASQAGDANYNAAVPVARSFSVGKAEQQITFEALANKTFGDIDFGIGATASSNLAVSFAAGGDCTVTGAQVHLTGAGTCTITASQDGDADYNAATPVARTFAVGKADQQITFDALTNKTVGDADFNVTAAASSNLAVAFSAGGNCTVAGNQVHLTGAGQCTINASQDGDANYNVATPVARAFSIGKAEQQITFDVLSNKKLGDADFNVTAAASSNLTVTLSAGGNCTINGTQVHLTAAGVCTITASQDGSSDYNPATPVARTFTIGKGDQQITFDALTNKKVGDADFAVAATASSNLNVSFAAAGNCTNNGTQVHLTGAGQCTITASQDGNSDYNAAVPVARTISIGKAEQQIVFDALGNKTVGDADFSVSATASSNLAVNFSAGGNCTVAGTQVHLNGAGACTITAAQDGDANYNPAAPVVRAFSIGKADQQITFEAPANKKVGDADFSVTAAASSNLTVAFSALGNCTVANGLVHLTGAGACTITASQEGNADYNPAAPLARTFSIGKADQQITFEALADKKFGDADFGINPTASSNLSVGLAATGNCAVNGSQVHLSGAGQCTITASQDGNSDYNPAAPLARAFSITKADQQISFAALANKKGGDPDFNVTVAASSGLAVSLAASGKCTVSGNQIHLTGGGDCTINASQDGNDDYNAAAAVSRTFSIGKVDQQIVFDALPDKKFGDADFNLTATASSGLAVVVAANGNCTVNGSLVHLNGAGACTLTASQDGNADYNPATPVARIFATDKADQQITFDALANKTLGDDDFNLTAIASSNLAVSFAASGNCTVAGGRVHVTAAGTCTITASQDGDANYNPAAQVANTFTIAEQVQQTLINFSSATYHVTEKIGVVQITVTRSGDTSGSSTVDYITDDTGAAIDCAKVTGLASSRCDFNTAVGTLTFAPGETEKTFEVLINQDSYLEGPFETFTVRLSNPTGTATLGTQATANVQIIDVSGGLSPNFNVVDDTRTFVRQQYHDFLNREPDAAGLNFWTDNIDQCDDPARKPASLTVAQCKQVMRIDTSAAFFLSIEFSQSGGLVHAFYAAALDRPNGLPNYLEFIRDTQAVGRGVIVGEGNWQQTLKENRDVFMKDFVMRPEFVGLYPTVDSPAAYVNKLYVHALGRTATAGELEQGTNEFVGAATAADPGARAQALLQVTKAADFSSEVNRSFVQMQYVGYLRRNANELPDANFEGYDFWLTKLNRFNGNYIEAEMVRAFIESGEYRARFGP